LGGALLLVGMFTFLVFPQQAFTTHFLIYNRLPFDKGLILPEILMFAIPLFVPLLAGADYLDSHQDGLVKTYSLVAVAAYFLLLFSSGSGADTNRCLEPVLILSCMMAARIVTVKGILSGLAWTGALAFTLVLVALLDSAFVIPKIHHDDFLQDRALQAYLRVHFPPTTSVLTYYPADPLRAGLESPITNLWHYSALIRKGTLSDRDIVERINHGGYGLILLDFDLQDDKPSKAEDFYTTKSIRDSVLSAYLERDRIELPTPEVTRFSTKTLHIWVPRVSTASEAQN
jgi:hypothetical protein